MTVGMPEPLGGVLHHRLRRDLRDRVALHAGGAVAVAERGVLLQVVVLVLLVHATRAAVEERVDALHPLHEVGGAVGVGGEVAREVVGLRHREVEDVVEVVGHLVEVAVLEVDADRRDARGLVALPLLRIGEAGGAVDGVVGRERAPPSGRPPCR